MIVAGPQLIPTSRPSLGPEELEAVRDVFASRWLGTGAVTKQFEDALAGFLGVRHLIAVNSGTAAIHVALEALDIGSGDEVVVPSLTFVSTIQAIVATGATPVFCDVELETAQLDVDDALARISPRTRAILPVHYGGSVGDMGRLLAAADQRGVRVVADAAHAFGSTWRGRGVTSLGDIACFSFDPIKNITCGTGGAAATDDDRWAAKLRPLANVGLPTDSWTRLRSEDGWQFDVAGPGYRYRMVDLNAAIGLRQLKRAGDFRARKVGIARRYDEALRDLPGISLLRRDWSETFPFLYAIRVLDGRQSELARYLRREGIGTTVHFVPNHLHSAFAPFAAPLPATERLYREILTLPLYVELSDGEVEFIVGRLRDWCSRTGQPGELDDAVR